MTCFQYNQERFSEFLDCTKSLIFEDRNERMNEKEKTKLANERMYFIRDYLAAIIDLEYVRKNVEFNKFMEVYEHFEDIQENAEGEEEEEENNQNIEEESGETDDQRVEGQNQQLTSFISMNNE